MFTIPPSSATESQTPLMVTNIVSVNATLWKMEMFGKSVENSERDKWIGLRFRKSIIYKKKYFLKIRIKNKK